MSSKAVAHGATPGTGGPSPGKRQASQCSGQSQTLSVPGPFLGAWGVKVPLSWLEKGRFVAAVFLFDTVSQTQPQPRQGLLQPGSQSPATQRGITSISWAVPPVGCFTLALLLHPRSVLPKP